MKIKSITSDPLEGIFVGGEGKDSYIAYKNGNGQVVILSDQVDSIEKPIHCSELYQKLQDRAWNKMDGTGFINLSNDVLMLKTYNDLTKPIGMIDEITDNDYIYDNTHQPAFYVYGYLLENSVGWDKIETTYRNLFGNMKAGEEVYFHKTTRNMVDILNGSTTVIYVSSDSDSYTNTVSFGDLISYTAVPGITGKANLTLQYVKENDPGFYTSDFSFTAFSYEEEDGKTILHRENFIKEINNDVELEYIGGVIKLLPLNNNVQEYIINNCSITYGNLK